MSRNTVRSMFTAVLALAAIHVPGTAAAVDCDTVAGLFALTAAPVVVTATDVDNTGGPALINRVRTRVFLAPPNPIPARCVQRLSMRLFYGRTEAEVNTARTRALNGLAVANTATLRTGTATSLGPVRTNPNLRDYRFEVSRTFAPVGARVFYRWAKVIDNTDGVAQDVARIHVFGPMMSFVVTPAPPPPPPLPNLVPELVGAQEPFRFGQGGSLGTDVDTFQSVPDSFCALRGTSLISQENVNFPVLGAGIRRVVQPPAVVWRVRNTTAVAVPAARNIVNEVINEEGSSPNFSQTIQGIAANGTVNMPAYQRAAVEVFEFPVAGGEGNCFVLVESDGSNPFRECLRLRVDTTNVVDETVDGSTANRISFGCN